MSLNVVMALGPPLHEEKFVTSGLNLGVYTYDCGEWRDINRINCGESASGLAQQTS